MTTVKKEYPQSRVINMNNWTGEETTVEFNEFTGEFRLFDTDYIIKRTGENEEFIEYGLFDVE